MYQRWRYPLLLIIAFVVVVCVSVPGGKVYGSTTDWFSQHVVLAETIRTACIEQGTLLPGYLPLGGGSNGFMFSYYGYLRPDILAGCLFPRVPMLYLVTGYMLLSYLACVLLFYELLLADGSREFMAFWGSVLFLLAACFFHTHRQVMFVNYMPFLLAAFLMVKRRWYGWVCVFLALVYCNSFYYGIAVLAALGWYWYREEGREFLGRYVKAAACSIGMAAALLVPTGLVILEHRRQGASVDMAELLKLRWDFGALLYSPYGMGLTAVCLYALFFGLGVKRLRGDSLFLLLISGVDIAAWILNGTLYARSKILIPFVPLVLLHCVRVFACVTEEKITRRFLPFAPLLAVVACYRGRGRFLWIVADVLVLFFVLLSLEKKKLKKVFCLMLLVLPACFFLKTAQTETYVTQNTAEEFAVEKNEWELVPTDGAKAALEGEEAKPNGGKTEEEMALYRFDSIYEPLNTGNRDAAGDRQKSTMYSSVYNTAYQKVYYDLLMTPIQINNRMALLAADNPFLLYFMGDRYVETEEKQVPEGYRIVEKRGNLVVAENEKVLPLAYLTEEYMEERTFEELDAYEKLDALMRTTVVEWNEKETTAETGGEEAKQEKDGKGVRGGECAFRSQMKERDVTWKSCVLPEGLSVVETEKGIYEVDAKRESRLLLELTEPVCGKILLLSFRVENRTSGAVVIDINQIRNKLSGKNAAYPNENEVFHYQFSEPDAEGVTYLELVFSPGKYRISEVQWHTYEKELLSGKQIVEVKTEKTEGNEILSCVAEAGKESLFVTSIPRQRGMKLLVDGEAVPMLTVNKAFVGAVIPEGEHAITLTFCPPGLQAGCGISVLAVWLFLVEQLYKRVSDRRGRRIAG